MVSVMHRRMHMQVLYTTKWLTQQVQFTIRSRDCILFNLELCGAQVLAKLLHYVKGIFQVPLSKVCALIDSTIVLNW